MKEVVFDRKKDKMIINTGIKTFDRQTNCIMAGNVLSNTQKSSYIRGYKNVKCDIKVVEGQLMNADIKFFQDRSDKIPYTLLPFLMDKSRTKSYILYKFFYHSRKVGKRILCWIVTDEDHKYITHCVIPVCGYKKSHDAANEIMRYICSDR
jgi:hypothetical protein